MKGLRRSAAGFTIIETMIVLAIAGVILMIVFEAVPALQRSSRNSQRRQDIQTILGATSQYELNHSGNMPATSDLTTFLTNYYQNKLTYYTPADVTVNDNNASVTPTNWGGPPPTSDPDGIYVDNYAKCDANGDGSDTNAGAGYNDIVALYHIETGNSSIAAQCQQL